MKIGHISECISWSLYFYKYLFFYFYYSSIVYNLNIYINSITTIVNKYEIHAALLMLITFGDILAAAACCDVERGALSLDMYMKALKGSDPTRKTRTKRLLDEI
jgi:hypothetical protein